MTTKDRWLKQDKFDEAFDRVRARVGLENMNGNMVIVELGTTSRKTAYDMFNRRMAAEMDTKSPTSFVLPESERQQGADMLAEFVTGIVDSALATKQIQLNTLENMISRNDQENGDLMTVLAETEAERDTALADVEDLRATINAQAGRITHLEAQIAVLEGSVVERMVGRLTEQAALQTTVNVPQSDGPLFDQERANSADRSEA
ncbi:hypothetical protein HZF05_03090 [Sphingomonas sp. CGMCC 1.13654]|uniref:Uncharacterized protein n=1 Tax=Sphingomonas chungangi TaxID=2683589 RepID=A0A838L4D9_9SPHN|nr:hypothetical protein [Sphingomonas chungangi]MBA2933076.1 hypothetical protein [Sphingomonas chungangi]MVW56696.1 hypothetical protein [Sphingomonas chungangi]